MKQSARIHWLSTVVVALGFLVNHGSAQGVFLRTITFDSHPVVQPGWNVGVTYYYEDSMTFRPMSPEEQFTRAGAGQADFFPDNQTGYLLQSRFDSLSGTRGGISRFGLSSVDLSEFSTLYNFPRVVQFIGYRSDGSVVTTEFTTDGIIDGTGPLSDFQTFYFNKEFSDLVRFEVPSNTYAMDNLVFFDVVPEPGVTALGLLGGVILAGWRLIRRNPK